MDDSKVYAEGGPLGQGAEPFVTLLPPQQLKVTRQAGFDTLCWVAAFVLLAASPALLIALWGWAL